MQCRSESAFTFEMLGELGQAMLHLLVLACLFGQFVVETLFPFGCKAEIVEQLFDEALGLLTAQARFVRHIGESCVVSLDERSHARVRVLPYLLERLSEFALTLIRLSEKRQRVVA